MQRGQGWALWVMVGVLLLAAVLTTPKLTYDALSFDEVRAYIVAGGAHHGPLTFPSGVWGRVAEQSPDQAMGFALLIWLWGALVGWTELAARTLPYLAGLLTIAMTYRVGRDLFSPFVGVSAVSILATSIFFITFMHKFRVFTIAALAVTAAMWCYWRIITAGRPGWVAYGGLLVSGVALFYTHYYMTPFVGVLGLYHLLFVRKNHRWWIPLGIFVIVLVIFLPELNVLRSGFEMNASNPRVTSRAMSPLQITGTLAHYYGHGFAGLFWVMLAFGLMALSTLPRAATEVTRSRMLYVWWCAVLMFAMILLVNELSQVFVISRVRYLMAVWSPLAVLIGVGLWRLNDVHPALGWTVLALWCGVGIWTTLDDELMWIGRGDQIRVHEWRELADAVFINGEPDDALIFQGKWYPQFGHYTHGIPIRWDVREYDGEAKIRESLAADYKRVWWGINEDINDASDLTLFADVLAEKGYVQCGNYLDTDLISLRLYGLSEAFCPVTEGHDPVLRFVDYLTLMQFETVLEDNTLVVDTGWAISPDIPLNKFSVTFVVVDDSEMIVAQGDVGFGTADGPYAGISAVIDLTGVTSGTYDLRTAVYDWQTGERVSGWQGDDLITELLPLTTVIIGK